MEETNTGPVPNPNPVSVSQNFSGYEGVYDNNVGYGSFGNGSTGMEGAVDRCKLFVGQVPPQTTEQHLQEIFSPYGAIKEITILKDRATQQSRGCGFVLFAAPEQAQAAIDNINNRITLPGAKREMIVNVAGASDDNKEYKLYIGMLSHKTTEEEIRSLFEPFGDIAEIYLMRNNDGSSKGSCFVKYRDRNQAQAAVDALNDKLKDKDAPSTLQVRFAHTKQEREQKVQQTAVFVPQTAAPYMPQSYQNPQVYGVYGQYGQSVNMMGYGMGYAMPMDPTAYGMPPGTDMSQYSGYYAQMQYQMPTQPQPQNGGNAQPQQRGRVEQAKGPAGANLFVYGIPDNYQDSDLQALFVNFGNVLSAKVQVDLQTGRSKGFGFVSFDSQPSAAAATAAMDGFVVGNRKLNVRVKKGEPGAPPMQGGYAPY